MSRCNYVEMGRSGKYFTTEMGYIIDNFKRYDGFNLAFQQCENGIFLRVDPIREIVMSSSVLDVINTVYADKDKEEKRNELKKALIGAIVMSNYGE